MRVLTVVLCFFACSALANTNAEEDTMVINALNSTDFEVVQDRSSAASVFWCGAGSYVQRRLGLSGNTQIYLKHEYGPSRTVQGTQGVVFSTSAAGLPPPDPERRTLRVDRPGDRMIAIKARQNCRDAFTRSTK